MISWAKGELICSWHLNNRQYVLLDCNSLGYEIQVLEKYDEIFINKELILWIHHVKKEDSDSLFGFKTKEERDFFRDLLLIKGIGPQIAMNLLKGHNINEILNSLANNDRKLISSVPGIGQKMTDRIFLELKNKYKNLKPDIKSFNKNDNTENSPLDIIFEDLNIALCSLEYSKKDIKEAIKQIALNNKISESNQENNYNEITFEKILKEALGILNG